MKALCCTLAGRLAAILLFSALLITGASSRQSVSSAITTPDQQTKILQQAQNEKKLILVEAFMEQCPFCKAMHRDVISSKEVQQKIIKSYLFIRIEVSKGKLPFGLQKNYNGMTPAYFILSAEGKLLSFYPGKWDKQGFLDILDEHTD